MIVERTIERGKHYEILACGHRKLVNSDTTPAPGIATKRYCWRCEEEDTQCRRN